MSKQMKWAGYFPFNDQKLDFEVKINSFGVCEYEVTDESVFNAEKGSWEDDEFVQREICALLKTFCNKEFTDTEQLLREYPVKNPDFLELAKEKVQEKGIKFNRFIVKNVDMDAGFYDVYKARKVQRIATATNAEQNSKTVATGNGMMKKIVIIAVVVIILIASYFMK